jgi:membrane protein DedA with SNARE-associated domain
METDVTATAATVSPGPPRRIGWQDVLIVAPIIANSIYAYAGVPLNALLVGTRPLLLSFLRGSTVAMIASGGFARVGRASLALALLAPVPISMITDPCYFYAGRRYARRIVIYLERTSPMYRRWIARGERFFKRWGIWTVIFASFLPVPNALIYLAAGESGMPFILFILADLFGTLMYIGVFVAVGWIAGQHAVDVAQAVTRYGWWITGGYIVLIIAWSVWSQRRARQVM